MAIGETGLFRRAAGAERGGVAVGERSLASRWRYEAIGLHNMDLVEPIRTLPESLRQDIRVVAQVLPFKTNRYVLDYLIDWARVPDDPIFRLTFPDRDFLEPDQYERIARLLERGAPAPDLRKAVEEIRRALNPHPAGQLQHNVPSLEGQPLPGIQHKYRETVLFFPSQGQTCHAYCSFCFRWPQFVGMASMKFAMQESESLREYVERHPDVSDVLFTGGDPLIMRTDMLRKYLAPLLEPERAPNVKVIRIGSKALSYWPQRFLFDDDAEDLLDLFRQVIASGRLLALMAHFNHPTELESPMAQGAIRLLRQAGVQIRTQTPLLRRVNDEAETLARLWARQIQLGCVPYYLFVTRDTGARRFFEVPLARAWQIYRDAASKLGGLARAVRGPSMSANPGKVQILGISEVAGEKVFVLTLLQARNPDWVGRPFFARFDERACWLDDLRPAFGEAEFFYEAELRALLATPGSPWARERNPVPVPRLAPAAAV